VDPTNYSTYLDGHEGDENSISIYYNNLDFTDFGTNSQWAAWVYDNPGVDTREPFADLNGNDQWDPGEPYRDYDGNGVYTDRDGIYGEFIVRDSVAGDTFWFAGDGVPDFAGPPPPPSPILTVTTSPGKVVLTWDGTETESFEDSFLKLPDFEGYRIYMSRTGQLGQYTLIADYDIIDYDSTYLDTTVTPPVQRLWDLPPRRLSEFPEGYNPEDHPDIWVPNGWNTGLDAIAEGDTIYSFTVSGLSETVGLYFAVTAFWNRRRRSTPSLYIPLPAERRRSRYMYIPTLTRRATRFIISSRVMRIQIDRAIRSLTEEFGFRDFQRKAP